MAKKRKLIDGENHQVIKISLYLSNDRSRHDIVETIAKALDINIGDPFTSFAGGKPFEEFMSADAGYTVSGVK